MITKKPGYIVACMECHNGKPEAVDTQEQAYKLAEIHFAVTNKPHGGHTVTITETTLVRLKK
jgi:hypothetical protein